MRWEWPGLFSLFVFVLIRRAILYHIVIPLKLHFNPSIYALYIGGKNIYFYPWT